MHLLAQLFRAAQLYAHYAHNTVSGPTFFSDHPFLGDLYEKYEGFYDDTIERMIGLGEDPGIAKITEKACSMACGAMADKECKQFFERLLRTNKSIYAEIGRCMKDADNGTQNLLQGFQDSLEGDDYKIKQRLR